jgi:membrane protein
MLDLLKETFTEWQEDDASRMAAALAYYAVFSLAPLLIIAVAVAGFFWSGVAARGLIFDQIKGVLGPDAAQLVQTMVKNAGDRGTGILSTVIGVITLLLGATGVFTQLQGALNRVWEVMPDPDAGLVSTVVGRVLSFGMVLGIGFLLLVSLLLSAAVSAMGQLVTNAAPGLQFVGQLLNFVVSLGVITLLFAMIYKILPDVEIGWEDVWVGAAATAFLFTVGKLLIGLYIGRASYGSAFGAAGSLVVILVWVYYSAQIVFLGAEFTQVYARRYGSRIVPDARAVWVPTARDRSAEAVAVSQRRDQARGHGVVRAGGMGAATPSPTDGAAGEAGGTKESALAMGFTLVVGAVALLLGRVLDSNRP